jgi:hypothetical protein
MADQFSAVRGKRPRYNYVAAINAEGRSLPGQIASKRSAELDKEKFALEQEALGVRKDEAAAYKQHLTSMDKFNQANLSFMEKQAKQSKKDSRLANMIGIGKLGTDVYFANKAANASAPAANLKGVLGGGGSPAGTHKPIRKDQRLVNS